MMSFDEIKEIFKKEINVGVLEGAEYLKDLDLYCLIIDPDPGVTDPHARRTSNLLTCIDGKTKERTYLQLIDYLEYTGDSIDI